MLVCPHCQFENPNTNKFCQKCGTSLTYKTCYKCNSQVPLSEEYCPNCSASTGTVWWAAIAKESDWQQKASALLGVGEAASATTSEPLSAHSDLEPAEQRGEKDPAPDVPTQESAVNESSVANTLNLYVADNPSVEDDTSTTTTEKTTDNPLQQSYSVSEEGAESLPAVTGQSDISANNEQQTPEETAGETPATTASNRQEQEEVEKESSGESVSMPAGIPPAAGAPSGIYLDPGQRYRLLEPLPPLKDIGEGEVHVRVLDTQPFQKSPLEALTAWNLECKNQQSEVAIGIPEIAQPYLALRRQFYPTLPQIHDAWHQDGTSVLLLEDRSQWQMLAEVWGKKSLPMLQILYWLDEMVKLWVALEPWQCRQTLLEVTNLRVDEDQMMSLQHLYREPKDATLTLKDLGEMWQTLSQQSQRTQFTAMDQLLRDLRQGEIETIEELRSRLGELARELQAETDRTQVTSASPVGTQIQMSSSRGDELENPEGDSAEGDDIPTRILPMQLLSLEDAGGTDIGRMRERNEDYFGIDTQTTKEENPIERKVQARGVYILCDGMGGHSSGEIASAMAVENIKRYFQANWHDQLPDEKSIREAVRLANNAIYQVNQQNSRSGSGRMGTTLVMVLIQETKVAVAHVGDSRLYRLSRKRGLEQITVDHEVGEREIQRGVERAIAYSRPDAYQLTQALGPRDENFVNPDIQFLELNEDTLLLLCSDGLSDHDLLETHWQTHLLPLISSRANLDQGVLQLIELANQHNGHDNITAVLVRAKVRPNLDQQ